MLPAHLGGAFLSPGQLTHNREFKLAAMHSSVHACSPLLGVLSQYTALLRRTSLSRLSGPVGSVHARVSTTNYPRPYNERTVSPIVVIVGAGAGRKWGGDPCGRPVGTFKSPWIIRQQTLAVACCRLYNRMQPHQNGYHGAPGKDCR